MMDYEKAFGKLPEDKPMWNIPIELVAYEKKILEQKKRIDELESKSHLTVKDADRLMIFLSRMKGYAISRDAILRHYTDAIDVINELKDGE